MSERDELIELATETYDEWIGDGFRSLALAAVVDALHDRLVGPEVEDRVWCEECGRVVTLLRAPEDRTHYIGVDGTCTGVHRVLHKGRVL